MQSRSYFQVQVHMVTIILLVQRCITTSTKGIKERESVNQYTWQDVEKKAQWKSQSDIRLSLMRCTMNVYIG
jgi:hypothetical protein